mgnify:CR=1 FL=1
MKTSFSKNFKRSVAAIAVSTILGMSTASADTGGLKFQVTDATGKPVAGAVVNVHTSESLVSRKGVTDANGYLRLSGLDPSTKYEVEIKKTEEKQKIPKEFKEELKASGLMDDKGKLKLKGVSPKMLKRMKQEFVDCPVLKREIQFIPCFVCPNFQSRVTGKVLCKGDKL